MSRLASFRGPSTPTSSPVQHKQPSGLASPSRTTESTFHRKTRTYLQELQSITETWDDLVLIDGLKAVQSVVDTRTDLHNMLASMPDSPRTRIVGPKLEVIEKGIADLENVVTKLKAQFRKMNTVVDNMEALVPEAHKAKGWQWVHSEPLWITWSLEKFVNSIPEILVPYNRSLNMHVEIVETLRSHSVSFDTSREAVSKWTEQPWLGDNSWDAKWEDICAVEVERWNK